jgi:carbonic anhydrase
MSILSEVLVHNSRFVVNKKFIPYETDRFPNKKIVIVTCMDTRLIELLPAATNLRQGDAIVLKTAGAVVAHPFGGVMRSILVAVYQLKAEEVVVIGHHDCGMIGMSGDRILEAARARGVEERVIQTLRHGGVDFDHWLQGFSDVRDSVRNSVRLIRDHPLLPGNVLVHGLVISPESGALEIVENDPRVKIGKVASPSAAGSSIQH